MFDQNGRLIPHANSVVYRKESRRYFTLAQPKLDLTAIYQRFDKHLKLGGLLSLTDFERRSEEILNGLNKNEATKNMTKGIHVPFICLPSVDEKTYLSAVGESFKDMFSQYSFTNHCKSLVEGKVAAGSRHDQLLAACKERVVVGWYFANCLSEYSVPSQREVVQNLPPGLMLSGIVDAASAFVGSPDLLMKNQDNLYPHLLCCSAIVPPDEKFFYHFEAYGWNLTFNYRSYIGAVAEYWAGGLSVMG